MTGDVMPSVWRLLLCIACKYYVSYYHNDRSNGVGGVDKVQGPRVQGSLDFVYPCTSAGAPKFQAKKVLK